VKGWRSPEDEKAEKRSARVEDERRRSGAHGEEGRDVEERP